MRTAIQSELRICADREIQVAISALVICRLQIEESAMSVQKGLLVVGDRIQFVMFVELMLDEV